MLGYELEEERREERPREPRYDAEDEPVDVEGDSLGWPEAAISVDGKLLMKPFALTQLRSILESARLGANHAMIMAQ